MQLLEVSDCTIVLFVLLFSVAQGLFDLHLEKLVNRNVGMEEKIDEPLFA